MTDNDKPMDEEQAFDELLRNDGFDDSVGEQHQSDLRFQMLEAFGSSSPKESSVVLAGSGDCERENARWNRTVGFAVILAICLIGVVAAWIYNAEAPYSGNVAGEQPVSEATDHALLLASLNEVNEFRDEVSREALFSAIAMCELDHEGRKRFGSLQP